MNKNNRVIRSLPLLIIFFLSSFISNASHMIGGDVTYVCLGNNQFLITLTLYQDCLNGQPQAIAEDNPAYISIFETNTDQLVIADSIEAESSEIVPPNFSNDCIKNYPNTCMRKQVFRKTITLAPSNNGYYIVYERCCRNAAINNISNPGNVGVTYFATIPKFSDNQCPNKSAVFKNFPPQIICANNPFNYDFSATDPDGDSLTYKLCSARPGGSPGNAKPYGNEMMHPVSNSVNYLGAYSAQFPMTGVPALQINPTTGFMTGTPIITGRFVVTVCVDEWRNGVVINTISRDVQFVVTNCSKTVVADIPELQSEPNTYIVQCKGFTVHFINKSTGGFNYLWNFGSNDATSTEFEPTFTYPDTGTYVVSLVVNKGSTCEDSISRLVKIYPEFHADYSWSGKLCPEEPIQFTDLSVATYPPVSYWNWTFGDGTSNNNQNPAHIYNKPGGPMIVTLIAKTVLGCTDTVKKILPLPFFDPNAGNDTIIVKGYPFNLHGSGAEFYQWTPPDFLSDPFSQNPNTNFPETGNYTYVLTGTSKEGCTGTDSVTIQVVDYGNVFIPNAFSPNGDGLNDNLIPRIVGYSRINYFQIFNRFGQQVFSSANENRPVWNGTFNGGICDLGTYYYVINLTAANGANVTKKGDVTIIR
jgi:gliding motility-associated-like protein